MTTKQKLLDPAILRAKAETPEGRVFEERMQDLNYRISVKKYEIQGLSEELADVFEKYREFLGYEVSDDE